VLDVPVATCGIQTASCKPPPCKPPLCQKRPHRRGLGYSRSL